MRKRILTIVLSICLAMSLTGCANTSANTTDQQTENDTAVDQVNEQNSQESANEQEALANAQATETEVEIVEEDNEVANPEVEDTSIQDQTFAKVVGEWVGYFTNNSKNVTARFSIKPTGEYKLDCVFGDDGWVHSYYEGKVESMLVGEEAVLSFTVEKTDDGNFEDFYVIGDYFVDAIRESEYGGKVMYLTQANNGDSLCDRYFGQTRPVFYEYDDPYANGAKYYEIKNPSTDYYYVGNETPSIDYALNQISIKPNDVTDTQTWFSLVGEPAPDYYWADEKYIYCKSTVRDYEYTHLDVYDNTSDDGEGELLYTFDMSDFQHMETNGESAFSRYVTQGIKYALIRDDVLYISTAHRTYAESCPLTGYITAIDINTGKVLWKTEPLINNADSFDFIGDTIVAGYGFTDEPDYLKIIDIKTGALVSQCDVKNAADYIKYKDGKLYVRCYSYDYIFDVVKLDE